MEIDKALNIISKYTNKVTLNFLKFILITEKRTYESAMNAM